MRATSRANLGARQRAGTGKCRLRHPGWSRHELSRPGLTIARLGRGGDAEKHPDERFDRISACECERNHHDGDREQSPVV